MLMALPFAEPTFSNHYVLFDYGDKFRTILTMRIEHCEKSFMDNLKNAKSSAQGQIAWWNNGHFSYPVYMGMLAATYFPINKWDALIWEQIIRQMARMSDIDPILFDIASERCLCGSNDPITRELVNLLPEGEVKEFFRTWIDR